MDFIVSVLRVICEKGGYLHRRGLNLTGMVLVVISQTPGRRDIVPDVRSLCAEFELVARGHRGRCPSRLRLPRQTHSE